jgi:GMP synthase (glutamine-hydrolysing)
MTSLGARAAAAWVVFCGVPSLWAADTLIGIENVFDRPAALAQASGPVICVVDTEYPDVIRERLRTRSVEQYKGRVLKQRVEQISGLPCVLVHYAEAQREDVERPNVKAIVLMSRRRPLDASVDREWFGLIRETSIPLIAFGAAHEMLAQAFGGDIGKMRPLMPGEPDPRPDYEPEFFKEVGFVKVRLLKSDPLFDGLVEAITVRQFHATTVSKLPAEFDTLAATDDCPVQVIHHRTRPLYGTQFLPQLYDDQHPDGRKLLENFFKIAGATK